MAQLQPLLYNKSILLDPQNFLQVQAYVSEPTQIVLKLAKKQEDGSIDTLGVFKIPVSHASFVSQAITEAQEETILNTEIEAPIHELYKKYGKERVDRVFSRVKQFRVGLPE